MKENLVITIKDKQFELFIKEETILGAICDMSKLITTDLHDKNPLFICVLNGAFMFASDLMKLLDFPCEIAFIRLKSYSGTASSGTVKEVVSLIEDVKNRHIVILEDIVDTGYTAQHLKRSMLENQPESLHFATLLFKPNALQTDAYPDYVGMEIPDDFIVGYGLDYDGYGRNLRDIYKIKE